MKEVEEQKKNLEKDLKLKKDKIIKLKYGSKNKSKQQLKSLCRSFDIAGSRK